MGKQNGQNKQPSKQTDASRDQQAESTKGEGMNKEMWVHMSNVLGVCQEYGGCPGQDMPCDVLDWAGQ